MSEAEQVEQTEFKSKYENKLRALKTELLKQVDKKRKIQVEKVDRYIDLVEIYYKLDASIEELGVIITVENGQQKFTKPNPAIAEKNKVNSSLIALGRDLGLAAPSPSPGNSSDNSKSDLI